MRKRMLYTIAAIVGLVTILAGAVYAWSTNRWFDNIVRQNFRDAKAAGKLPPDWEGVDIETMPLADVQMKVTDAQMLRLDIATLFQMRWYVLVPLVIMLCFGLAWLVGKFSSSTRLPP